LNPGPWAGIFFNIPASASSKFTFACSTFHCNLQVPNITTMKKSLIAFVCAGVMVSSCESSGEKTASQSQTPSTQQATNPLPIVNPAPVTTPSGNTGSTTTTTAAGMNPEHGKPGHRCDIPVGASLSTPVQKPATNITPTTVTPPAPTVATAPMVTPTNTTTSTTPATVAPGMNPAHGQPGHRCEIPVGAPLNSKPATQTITTTPNKN
jgi:hypothetical protein